MSYLTFSAQVRSISIALLCCFSLFTQGISQVKMYWSDVEIGQILVKDLDGGEVETILAENFPAYHVLDFENDRIYWTDTGTKSVHSVNFDGSDEEVLISGLTEPQGIVLNDNNDIVLVDHKRIARFTTDGDFIANVVTGLNDPTDLVIHGGDIFWGDKGSSSINYVPEAGGSAQELLPNVYVLTDIDVNELTDELYWSQSPGTVQGSGIFKANTDGSGRTTVLEDFVNAIAIDAINEVIYWSDGVEHTIQKGSLNDVGNSTPFVQQFLLSPKTISIDPNGGKLFFINDEYDEFLFSADLASGLGVELLASSEVYRPSRFELDTAGKYIYWINSSGPQADDESAAIMRARMDGSDIERLISYPQVQKPFGLDIDLDAGKMYWTDMGKREIASANLDGGDIKSLVTGDLLEPRGIAIDKVNNQLYWTDATTAKIERSALDGSGVVQLLSSGLTSPYEIFVVPEQNRLYFTDYGAGFVGLYDFTSKGFEILFTTQSPQFNRPNSVYVDWEGGKVYFTVDYEEPMIMRMNLDGSEPEEVSVPDINSPHDIEIVRKIATSSSDPFQQDKMASRVFPNPCQSRVFIESSRPVAKLELIDTKGTVLNTEIVIEQVNISYNMPIVPSQGIFLLRVIYKDGTADIHAVVRM